MSVTDALVVAFAVTQVLYLISLSITAHFYLRPVRWVDPDAARRRDPDRYPMIVLFYPVLREAEDTMRTTFCALERLDYPDRRFRVVAIPNHDDAETIESLGRLSHEFDFVETLAIPATSDPSWQVVWDAWDANPAAYWWHVGPHDRVRDLPPKKTRQLVYAFYTLVEETPLHERHDMLINYIDADSAPPPDHFLAAAAGIERYDVLQSTNVAGNLLDTWAASMHSMDHMCWDGSIYPHISAGTEQPYWVLGKGLFFRMSQLVQAGSFNPWLTIEDPEVGMRMWTHGRRLGVIEAPLIEEVPNTFRAGVTQRKRWICGFFQSLHTPLKHMGMSFGQRMRARLNFAPCMFLLLNPFGLPVAVWSAVTYVRGGSAVPEPLRLLGAVNLLLLIVMLTVLFHNAWQRSALVLDRVRDRIRFVARVNPLFLMAYWIFWIVPILIGFEMFLRDKGRVWERTEKLDANHELVRRADEVVIDLREPADLTDRPGAPATARVRSDA